MRVITLFALAKASEIEWIVLPRGVDVVGEQIVVGDKVALVGVVPEPASVLDQLSIVVNQGIVEWNDAVLAVTSGRVLLQPFEVTVLCSATSKPVTYSAKRSRAGSFGNMSPN